MAFSSWFVDERSVDIEEFIAEDLENLEQADTTAHITAPLQPPPEVLEYASPNEEDQTDNVTSTEKALLHFNNMINYYLRKPYCITTTEHFPLAQSFAFFTEDEKNNLVRAMMLCLCAPRGKANALMATDSVKAQSKRDKWRRLSSSSYSSTKYAMRGKWVCQFGFAAIVQINPQTIRGISSVVGNQETFSIQKNEHYSARKGKQSLQTVTALAFLQRYAALDDLACLTGRGSEDESPVEGQRPQGGILGT